MTNQIIEKTGKTVEKMTVADYKKKLAEFKKSGKKMSECIGEKSNNQDTYPFPIDGMTLDDLKRLPKDDLEKEINHIASLDNKSYLIVMYAEGYAFSWSQLLKELEGLGYRQGFVYAGGSVQPNVNDEYTVFISPAPRLETKSRSFTFEKDVLEMLENIIKRTDAELAKPVISKIVNEIFRTSLRKAVEAKERGKLKIKYRETEIT